MGGFPSGAIVLIHSGWGKFWGDRKRYFGTDEPGDVADLHFPGLSKEAAEFLVKQRRVKAVGIDTPSIDHGPSHDFIVHQILGAANVPIFENVAALDRSAGKRRDDFRHSDENQRRQRRAAANLRPPALKASSPMCVRWLVDSGTTLDRGFAFTD